MQSLPRIINNVIRFEFSVTPTIPGTRFLEFPHSIPSSPSWFNKLIVMIAPATNSPDFEYVVERKPPQAICFGSRLPRNTNLIGKGLSGYQKMQAMELFPNIGPGQYNTQKYKTAMERVFRKVAGKGAGALASNEPRFRDKIYMRTPSPTRYNVAAPWGPQSAGKAPFGSKSRRVTMAGDKLPG